MLKEIGNRYKDFEVTKSLPLAELHAHLIELVHIPSGACIMHIQNDDPENLFCLSFRTYPQNSSGVAHILEHTVLCGSKKFPVKDPFFCMARRSLNTYMNALTGSDFTCYPAASQNEKDFYNLLNVYLDAVFHPNLTKNSFLQEGHRYEFKTPDDSTSPLLHKGVVYNEMKGSMASAERRMWQECLKHLCPDLTYAHNSGGDPKEIPALTYEELINFYEVHYHPSQCLFFFYGNLPLIKHLDYLYEHTLHSVPEQKFGGMGKQTRFLAPKVIEHHYPSQESKNLTDKCLLCFAFLTAHVHEQKDLLALSVLESILLDTDASLLSAPLQNSGLCKSVDGFMDLEMSEVPFAIVCRGLKQQDAQKIDDLLVQTLEKICQKGIDDALIESSLHQLELSRTEINNDHAPFGLSLFFRAALAKQHGCHAEDLLTIHTHFAQLRQDCKDPDFFPRLIRKYLLQNKHKVRLLLLPDVELGKKEAALEEMALCALKERLSEAEKQSIIAEAQTLLEEQNEAFRATLECLPKIHLSDITHEIQKITLTQQALDHHTVYFHECFTNQMVYADLCFDLADITTEELFAFKMLISMLAELGVGDRTYEEQLQFLHAHTGGIGAHFSLHPQATDPDTLNPCFTLRSKALKRNAHTMLHNIFATLTSLRLDETSRIKDLVEQMAEDAHTSLAKGSMRYAIQLALQGFSKSSWMNERLSGLSFYEQLMDLKNNLDEKLPAFIKQLVEIRDKIFAFKKLDLILSCDQASYDELALHGFAGFAKLQSGKPFHPFVGNYPVKGRCYTGRLLYTPVAFTCMAIHAPTYNQAEAAAISVIAQLLDNLILHTELREKRGAYGSGVTYMPMTGKLYFTSYRDPHIASTFTVYQTCLETLIEGKFSEDDLEEAKLCVFQILDSPISPSHRASASYSLLRDGKTDSMRQKQRDRLFALTKDQVQDICRNILAKNIAQDASMAFIAGIELYEKEKAILTSLTNSWDVKKIKADSE